MAMRLSLILVMLTSVYAERCPTNCECRSIPRDTFTGVFSTKIFCDGYVNVTNKLPESTEELVLRNVVESDLVDIFESLSTNIAYLPYLAHISVSETTLPDLLSVTLIELNRLRSLKFTFCDVATIPDTFFNLTSLQSLDLSHNKVKLIEQEPFRTLIALEVLNLSANAIDIINPDSFSGLSALKSLDLTENNLNNINDKVLLPLVALQHLNLSRNRLEVLNEACFSSLLHLQQLDVSWNRLARVAPGTLQLPSLARLLLAGNPMLGGSRQPGLLVGTGRRLQTVDASRTGLKQVPAALTHSIRTLRLAGNSIKSVNCGDLDSYPLLQLLDFTSNGLETIEDDALGRLDSLSVLYLTDNKLHSIPRSLPEKLQVLHLEHNKIEQIQAVDLLGLQFLEVLLLSSNKIKVVHDNAFSQLGSLETLDLSRNPISMLMAGILSGPIGLRVLKLSNIDAIPPAKEMAFPLSTPEHLITLDLSSSPGLARQLLVDVAALAAARELQELDLSNSGLNFIRSDILHFLPQLRALRLQDNPLNCTDLQWLAFWMRKQDSEENRKIVCSSPPELWGTLLIDLQNDLSETKDAINQTSPSESNKLKNVTRSVNHLYHAATTEIPPGISVYSASGNTSFRKWNDETTTPNTPRTREPQGIYTFYPRLAINRNNTPTKIANVTPNISNNILTNISTQSTHIFPTAEILKSTLANKSYSKSGNDTRDYLYIPPEEKPLNKRAQTPTRPAKIVTKGDAEIPAISGTFYNERNASADEQRENVTSTTGQMSLYLENHDGQLAHPGMLILAIGVVGALALLLVLTTRFSKRREGYPAKQDVEVSSLPSVTELW